MKPWLVIVVLLLAIAFLTILSNQSKRIKMNPSGTIGNTASNLNNGGLFCENNSIVYFSNPYDGGSLYSMNSDGSNIKKLGVVQVTHILADDNYLYYFQESASGLGGLGYIRSIYGIYQASHKGTNIRCLVQDYASQMQLVDNFIYYQTRTDSSFFLNKVKIDKSLTTPLFPSAINPSCSANGVIYYNGTETNHYLYALNPTTDTSSIVWEGNLWYPVFDNGYIYYLDVANNYRLCRYSLEKDSVDILTHDRVDCFNVGYGYIYYQCNSSQNPALKKMNLDGSQVEIIASGNYTAINMTSRYVYFQAFGSDTPTYYVPLGGGSVCSFTEAQEAAMKQSK